MEHVRQARGELLLGFHRVAGLERGELFRRGEQEEVVVDPHGGVGHRHDAAEHVLRAVVEGDVVAEGLRHLLLAVEADEQGHAEHGLRGHLVLFLQVAADEHVEELVAAADLDVGLEHDGVVALEERVEELDDRDGGVRGVTLGEVIAREHLRHGHAAAELEGVEERHLAEPLAVAADLGLLGVEDLEGLLEVGLGVLLDLLLGEDGARLGLAGGVADARGVVADDEDGLVAELLELAELVEDDHVAEGQVGSGRVDAELHAQGLAGFEALEDLRLTDEFLGAGFHGLQLFRGGHGFTLPKGQGRGKEKESVRTRGHEDRRPRAMQRVGSGPRHDIGVSSVNRMVGWGCLKVGRALRARR